MKTRNLTMLIIGGTIYFVIDMLFLEFGFTFIFNLIVLERIRKDPMIQPSDYKYLALGGIINHLITETKAIIISMPYLISWIESTIESFPIIGLSTADEPFFFLGLNIMAIIMLFYTYVVPFLYLKFKVFSYKRSYKIII